MAPSTFNRLYYQVISSYHLSLFILRTFLTLRCLPQGKRFHWNTTLFLNFPACWNSNQLSNQALVAAFSLFLHSLAGCLLASSPYRIILKRTTELTLLFRACSGLGLMEEYYSVICLRQLHNKRAQSHPCQLISHDVCQFFSSFASNCCLFFWDLPVWVA